MTNDQETVDILIRNLPDGRVVVKMPDEDAWTLLEPDEDDAPDLPAFLPDFADQVAGLIAAKIKQPERAPQEFVDPSLERIYTLNELAALLKMDRSTVRRIFQDEPGVLKLGKENRRDGRRDYVSYRVPRSVVLRKFPQLKA
jgi:AraC-like DNA-binding protein